MELKIYTDGGALGNPGPAASAYIIYNGRKIVAQDSKFLGHGTNNQAEYTALILAYEKIKDLLKEGQLKGITIINVFSDSSLLVNQLNGLYKVKNGAIREFILKIRILENEIGIPTTYKHVYREENTEADALVKEALSNF